MKDLLTIVAIPKNEPMVELETEDKAKKEAIRLSEKYPDFQFFVLKTSAPPKKLLKWSRSLKRFCNNKQ